MPAEATPLRSRSRFFALAAAAAMVLAMVPLATSGRAQSSGQVTKLEAQTNVEAAIEISQTSFGDGSAEDAFLGREDLFADLLSSGGGQGLLDAPLLLTESAALNAATAGELERLGVKRVIILGGDKAVSEDVANDLRARGYTVQRIKGPTRLETAIELAQVLFPDATSAILARAFEGAQSTDTTQAFADSLAAGGWAADWEMPVLLTESDRLSESTRRYFESPTITDVYIVGGEGAVSPAVVLELEAMGKTVHRIAEPGGNRFSTAVLIADQRGFPDASAASLVILSEGGSTNAFASGFPAASLSARGDAPIVLSAGDTLPDESEEFLSAGDGTQFLICGPYTTDAACDAAAEALGITGPDCPSPSATPSASASATASASASPSGLPTILQVGPTATGTACPSPSASPSVTATTTRSPSPSPSATCIPVPLPIPGACPTPTPSASPSQTPSATPTT